MQSFIYKIVEEDETCCLSGYYGDEENIVIPDTYWGKPVTIIFDDVFKGHQEIKTVKIPDSVREIGGFVFDRCDNLTEIKLPDNLENIWQYAFVRSGFSEIILPQKLKFIPPFAFKDCKNLKKVICNDSLQEICAWAFQGCDNLSDIQYSATTKVNPKAFE